MIVFPYVVGYRIYIIRKSFLLIHRHRVLARGPITLLPVSYTHLDVYKRQYSCCSYDWMVGMRDFITPIIRNSWIVRTTYRWNDAMFHFSEGSGYGRIPTVTIVVKTFWPVVRNRIDVALACRSCFLYVKAKAPLERTLSADSSFKLFSFSSSHHHHHRAAVIWDRGRNLNPVNCVQLNFHIIIILIHK